MWVKKESYIKAVGCSEMENTCHFHKNRLTHSFNLDNTISLILVSPYLLQNNILYAPPHPVSRELFILRVNHSIHSATMTVLLYTPKNLLASKESKVEYRQKLLLCH